MLSDITLEKQILASSINYLNAKEFANGHILVDNVEPKHFYSSDATNLFNLIAKCLKKDVNPTPTNLINIGSTVEEKDLIYNLEEVPGLTNILPYLARLKTISKGRSLLIKTANMKDEFNDGIANIENVYSEKEKSIQHIINEVADPSKGFYAKEELSNHWESFNKKMNSDEMPGILTGLKGFDDITGGLRKGENVLICGRPGMGKTSLALTIICHQILAGLRPAYFSLELTKDEIYNKLYSMLSHIVLETKVDEEFRIIPYQWLRTPNKHVQYVHRMTEISQIIYNSNLYINFDPSMDMNLIRSTCRNLKYGDGVDSVWIDHIGRMVKNRSQEYAEITQISSDCKNLALEIDTTMCPLVQLKRDAEKRGEPTLSDLKGSGALEEDGDIIISPWRPHAIDKDKAPEEAFLIALKARNSRIDNLNLKFSTVSTVFDYVKENLYSDGSF